jgi:superfamily II DNA or RNA helicase
MQLRPYQLEAVDALRKHVTAGNRKLLMVLPTGGGKTVVAAAMIRSAVERGKRVLFVAHRRELLTQTRAQLRRFGVEHVGIIRADDPLTDPTAPVQVASIATLVRRDPTAYDLCFIDECHRARADGYQSAVFDAYPNAVHIGLTATPVRGDGRGLSPTYDALVVAARYSDLIAGGSIIAPRVFSTPLRISLDGVRTTAGDYNTADLESAADKPELIGSLVDTWRARANGRRTVVFATGVDHSRSIVGEFQRRGVLAAHLDGETPEDERAQILLDLEAGNLEVVSNCMVLTEGWDQPAVKCCILARPTKSLGLYMQMAGRILRPWQDTEALLLDHAGNVDRHGFPHEDREWTLEEGAKKRPAEVQIKTCPECFVAFQGPWPCPECGHVPEVKEREPIRERAGELAERTTAEDPKRAFFLAQVETARGKGWKPGAASARYKEKFGAWPPWGWSQSVKAMYDADPQWQADVETTTKRREYWAAKKAETVTYDAPPPAPEGDWYE